MPENRPISEEEKKMILKNTDKYRQQLEELEHELATETKEKESKTKQKPNVNLDDDPTKLLGPKKETVITKITDKQYDIKGEQKRLRRKKTYREYGYQRLYLLEKIKVSTMILMVILMILCIVLILRFFSLDMERYMQMKRPECGIIYILLIINYYYVLQILMNLILHILLPHFFLHLVLHLNHILHQVLYNL